MCAHSYQAQAPAAACEQWESKYVECKVQIHILARAKEVIFTF